MNIIVSFFKKNVWIIIPIFFVLIFIKNFPFYSYVAGGDSFPLFYTTDFIYQQFGVWASSVSYGAVIGQANYVLFLPLALLVDFLKILFGDFGAQYLYFAFIFSATPLGVYILLRSFNFSKSTSLIGGLFYGLHFLVWSGLTRNVIPITNLFLFTPYIVAFIKYFLDTNKKQYLVYLLILGFFNVSIISNPWTFIVQGLIILVFLLRYGNFKKLVLSLTFIYFFCIAGAIVLFTMFFNSHNLVNDEWNNVILKGGAMAREARDSILVNTLRGYNGDLFGGWGYVDANINTEEFYYPFPYYEKYKTFIFMIVSFIPVILIISSNILKRNKKILYWTIIFLLSLLLFKSIAEPFGKIFNYCLNNIPLCGIFRSPHQKISLLFVLSLIMILSLFRDSIINKKYKFCFDISILTYIFIMGSFLFFYPYISRMNILEDIPASYKESANIINKNQDIKNIMVLPFNDSTWINTDFGFEGYPLHSYLLPQKQIYGRNDLSFSSYAENLHEIVGPSIKKRDPHSLELLKKYNIDTLIYDGYADRYTRFLVKEQHERNIYWLDNLDGLQKIGTFGKIHLYYTKSTPLVLGREHIYKKYNPTQYEFSTNISKKGPIAFLQSFHPDWRLYLEPYSKIDCQNPIAYTNQKEIESQYETYIVQLGDDFPKIGEKYNIEPEIIKEQNPDWDKIGNGGLKIGQEIQIPLEAKEDPVSSTYLQQSSETYSVTECKSENKFYIGGELSKLWETPIFDETHTTVYDYANQWTLDADYIKTNYPKEYYKENPDGSIDIKMTLYFKPQSYFYLGLIISGTTFLLLILWLIIGSVRDRKKKEK